MGNANGNFINKLKESGNHNIVIKAKKGNDTAILEEIVQTWDDELIQLAIAEDGALVKLLQDK